MVAPIPERGSKFAQEAISSVRKQHRLQPFAPRLHCAKRLIFINFKSPKAYTPLPFHFNSLSTG